MKVADIFCLFDGLNILEIIKFEICKIFSERKFIKILQTFANEEVVPNGTFYQKLYT